MAGGLRPRSVRALVGLSALVVGSLAASGCASQNGAALAKQACTYVSSSISTYESSLKSKSHSEELHLQDEAYDKLQLGLQPAALATGDSGQWQALMATISESSHVPEGLLVDALQQQCAVADNPNSNG